MNSKRINKVYIVIKIMYIIISVYEVDRLDRYLTNL